MKLYIIFVALFVVLAVFRLIPQIQTNNYLEYIIKNNLTENIEKTKESKAENIIDYVIYLEGTLISILSFAVYIKSGHAIWLIVGIVLLISRVYGTFESYVSSHRLMTKARNKARKKRAEAKKVAAKNQPDTEDWFGTNSDKRSKNEREELNDAIAKSGITVDGSSIGTLRL
jgi:hypothetical protein